MATSSFDEIKSTQGESIPNLEIAKKKFILTLPEHQDDDDAKSELLEIIRTNKMAPWYESICQELGWTCNNELLQEMISENKEVLSELDKDIQEAKRALSKSGIQEALIKKAQYLIKIGDQSSSIQTMSQAYANTLSSSYKLENIFTCIRIGFFFMDFDLITRNLDRAQELVEMGSDCDQRNRLKMYRGVYSMAIRDFRTTADNFLYILSTFDYNELMDYTTFIQYTVIAAALTLSRQELCDRLIKSGDMMYVLHQMPDIKGYLFSFYQCEYGEFFQHLANIEDIFRKDHFLNPHYRFYVREMKLLAYTQMLTSYESVSLSYMAEQFEVTPEFIVNELSALVAEGRIFGRIDLVDGIISMNKVPTENKGVMFKEVVKKGDSLNDRIDKLSRNVNNK